MGHQVDFHRVPCRLLTAPLSATQLRDLSQWKVDLNPKPTESVGDFLARWIEAAGWVRHQSDFIRAIEGAESFEGWDREASRLRSELGYVAEQSPDPVLRFLHHGASRADFQAHLARLPVEARRLAMNGDVVCLAAEETRALAAVDRSHWEDYFDNFKSPPSDDAIEIFHAFGDGAFVDDGSDWPEEYRPDKWPQATPQPYIPIARGDILPRWVLPVVLIGGSLLLLLSMWWFGGCG